MTDRMEVTRQRAAELHRQAVANGLNPTDAYAFALAEAERRGIEVNPVPIGDARLYGGRAVFDPDSWVIFHEVSGNAFTDAFLVSHELGHVEFGGEEEAFTAIDVDPNRASGSTGMGADRVVDYSRHQRREVQMDLFAREFLLPRPWLRTMHVDSGKSANEIVSDLQAPRSVIIQQLLDAVFLPVIELEPAPEDESPVKYNKQQIDAMRYHGETALLLKAGPGTGKTRTLIGRIEHLLTESVSPESILVLTFSNKAAGELSERLAIANPDAAARVWIGTFHSFGLDFIRRFHDRLELPEDPKLLSTSETVAMVEEFYPGLKLKRLRDLQYPSRPISKALKAISRANDEVVVAQGYAALADAMLSAATNDDEIMRAEQCVDVAQIYSAYESEKHDRGQLDFGDLVSMPVRLCETDAEVRQHLSGLYQHVLVDEFQDVNRSSVRLLKSLCPTGRNLWVVGDSRQSIYRFRGASSYNLQRFCETDFPGGKVKHLTQNYRSVPEINAVVDQFAETLAEAGEAAKETESTREPIRLHPEIRAVEMKSDESGAIAEAIHEMRGLGYSFRDQAVICKGNARLAELASELENRGIPVLFFGNLFERDEVRDLLSLLSVLVDGRATGLLRVAAMDEFAMSIGDVSAVIDTLREHEAHPMDWIKNLSFENVSKAGQRAIERLRDVMKNCHPRTEPWDLLASFLFDHTRIAAELAGKGDVVSRSRCIAIWQFMNFARTVPAGDETPTKRLLDQVRQLVLYNDDRELRQLPKTAEGIDAVRLMTMHGSKGLESPIVHVASLTAKSIPMSGKQQLAKSIAPPNGMVEGADESGYGAECKGLEEEQKCLFFVSLSRAMDRLILYRHKKQSNGWKQSGSRFLVQLGATVQERDEHPKKMTNGAEDLPTSEIRVAEPFELTDFQIALHKKCPARFMYTHVLQTGGRRKQTAYMRLHDAVQEVVNQVAGSDGGPVSATEAEKMLDQAMADRSFTSDEANAEYRSIAGDLVRILIAQSSRMEFVQLKTHLVQITGGTIAVTPDQIIRHEDGGTVIRRIRTGHAPSTAVQSLESTLLQVAANSTSRKAELLHLSDDEGLPIEITEQNVNKRLDILNGIGESIIAGQFTIKAGENCPHCAAYFICGKLPVGKITKKISR